MDILQLKSYSLKDDTLRGYQQDNKQKIYDALERVNSVMLQMPTGTGKTRLFVSIIKDIFQYSRDNKQVLKVLVLVHRTELIDQIDEELGFRYNLAHGIIQAGEKERKIYPIQLASVQTLGRRLDKWTDKEFDFIIVDEAHHVKADSYQKIIKTFPRAKLLGVTATPVRLNGHGFTDIFDELIVSPSVKQFINDGYLSQYEYYSVARSSFIQQEIDGIKKFSQGDFAESELERVCDNDRIRAQVVKTYLDFANNKKGIVYTVNKEHNKNLCKEFNEKGVHAVAIDSDTPKELREKYIQQFRRGDFQIICNVNLFTEGFDCPDIEFVQLARPTKSLALYLQQVGRGLRISESKEKTLFLDNVGLYNRFGFPSSRRMWKHHFEGKYDGNKTEEEVEKNKEQDSVPRISRGYHQNLDEGNEKVHLIQTTDEKEYLEKRTNQLKEWLQEVFIYMKDAYNKAYLKNYVQGLELTCDHSNMIRCCVLKMVQHTLDLDTILKTKEFYFRIDKDEKLINVEHRLCKDIDELVERLDLQLDADKRYFFKDSLDMLIQDYNALNFSQGELIDIVSVLYDERWQVVHPYDESNLKISYFKLIMDLFVDSFITNKRKSKPVKELIKTAVQIVYR